MVNKRSSNSKRPQGRPAIDPADRRTERFSFRIHPHLFALINELAHEQGTNHSLWLEKAAIAQVHRDLDDSNILTAHGRRRDSLKPGLLDEIRSKPKKR